MKKHKPLDERATAWIDRHSNIVGIGLVLIVITGGITLSLVQTKPKIIEKPIVDPAIEEELAQVKAQNDLLRKQIEEINKSRVAGVSSEIPKSKLQNSNKLQSSNSNTQTQNAPISGLININTADGKTLESLPKIGPVTAQKIIDYRTVNGTFKTIADIKKVKGIGDKTFEQIRGKITVE